MKATFGIFAVTTLFIAWVVPMISGHSFTLHMIRHMLIVAPGSLFLALYFPSSVRFPGATSPILASIMELVVVWGWHAPGPHQLARSSEFFLILEQTSFLLVGIWLWFSSFRNCGAGVIALLLTSMHMTFLGALLGMSPRILYGHHGNLDDLHLGGAVMIIGGGLTYLCGGLFLTRNILGEKQLEKLV